MHHTPNPISSAGSQIGTILQVKVARLLLAFRVHATRVVQRGDPKGKVLRPLAVVPRARLRTFTLRTSQAFPWSITRLPLLVVAGLQGEEDLHVVPPILLLHEGLREVLAVVVQVGGQQLNVVAGEAGETGKRCVLLLCLVTSFVANSMRFFAEQSYSGIFRRYFTSVDNAGRDRVPSLG